MCRKKELTAHCSNEKEQAHAFSAFKEVIPIKHLHIFCEVSINLCFCCYKEACLVLTSTRLNGPAVPIWTTQRCLAEVREGCRPYF